MNVHVYEVISFKLEQYLSEHSSSLYTTQYYGPRKNSQFITWILSCSDSITSYATYFLIFSLGETRTLLVTYRSEPCQLIKITSQWNY